MNIPFSSSDFMKVINSETVDKKHFAIWHLGQNSHVLKSPNNITIGIDPYLSNSCGEDELGNPNERSRILPVFIEPEDFDVDILLLTHSHRDHTNLQTLSRMRRLKETIIVGPYEVKKIVLELGVPISNFILLHPKETIEIHGLSITGTFALPTDSTDLNHIGFLIDFKNGKKYYNSGDTAYTELLSYLKDEKIELGSICINGGYNNLSHYQAALIAKAIECRHIAPSHYDVMPHNWQPPEVFKGSLRTLGIEKLYYLLEYFKPHFF